MTDVSPTKPPKRLRWKRRLRRMSWSFFALCILWVIYGEATLLRPPEKLPKPRSFERIRHPDGTLTYGPSYLRRHGGVWAMGLSGRPVDIGFSHGTLGREVMFDVERRLLSLFAYYVPSPAMRMFISTLVRGTHRGLPDNFPTARLQEIAAEAAALEPIDPFQDFMPTYHRVVTLHALYDISLGFEHSPLLGCTALFAAKEHSADGHTYVGRNFDMEIEPSFDTEKVVFLMRPEGKIPFASVAWPGLTGVVTGLNLSGIFVAVHGGRAREVSAHGVPVPTTLRTIMEEAHTLEEAIAIARRDPPMVSHILFIVDGDAGHGVVLERAPGYPLQVRELGSLGGTSNHYFDPSLSADPKNQAVRHNTSTLARQLRVDELTREHDGHFDPNTMLAILRDKRGPGGTPLPYGHRGTVDAWIATHSVLADASARVLWVSTAPHTLGHYERFELRTLLASEYSPTEPVQAPVLPADTSFTDGSFQRWQRAHERLNEARSHLRKRPADALRIADEVLQAAAPLGDMDALVLRAEALTALGRRTDAQAAWQRVLAAQPSSPAEREAAEQQLRALGATPLQVPSP